MKAKLYLRIGLIVLLSYSTSIIYAQTTKLQKVVTPIGFDKLENLSKIQATPSTYMDRGWKENLIPNKDGFLEEFNTESSWTKADPVLQNNTNNNRTTSSIAQNFPGVSNLNGVAPPDTDGDVGLTHYMQMVNLSLQIWDKSGNSVYGPVPSSTIWDGFVGPWTGTNDGDPIVLYDEYSDKWIASQFSLPNYPSGPFYELVAVSESGDPSGAWYRYAYEFANMPDYPKFGVWPDGYYFTINQFAPPNLSFAGAAVCVLDRAAMINGDPNAQMLFFNLGTSYGSLLPADADGSVQPSTSSPNYLLNLGVNSLRIWEANIDWVNTSNSNISLSSTLSTEPHSLSGISINQPGTSQTLDALTGRLMYRLQYRNFGSYEVMLTNHTVNADGNGQAGVRWYELRNYGSGWSIYQQGTYAPADGENRWMASIAMNGDGDIGLGYSVSSSNTYPSIRYTGQTASNSGTGILDVSETSIVSGSMSQTGVNRWGDYSMMSIDPSDDHTFWYTTEYSNGGWSWQTQIASFSFDAPVIDPPIADFSSSSTTIMEGQTVSFVDQSSNNPSSWSWSFPGGTPANSTDQNPTVSYQTLGTYDVSLIATNISGSDEIIKTSFITVDEFSISYCTSSGSNASLEWIENFEFGGFSNNSGSDGGFGDYTSQMINIDNGSSINLDITPGFSGRSQREYWRVWIDYNMDGDFSDSNEEVFIANRQRSSVSGIINIPSGLVGESRMRVSMKRNSAPLACENFSNGEVEDYTINFQEPIPLPPIADFSANPNTVEVGNNVQFTDLSANNPNLWSWSFSGGTPSSSTIQNPNIFYNIEGLYSVTLSVSNNEGSNSKTITEFINVIAVGNNEYCTSESNSNALEWISQIDISSFSNSSDGSTYSDFTNMTINLAAGSTNNVTLVPYFTGKSQREFWRIWIDYNGDGDFDDIDEQVLAANNKRSTVYSSFSVPSNASGQTRMRISMKNGSAPGPCETFSNGEVEDYTVDFGNMPSSNIEKNILDIELYPNPAKDILNVKLTSFNEKVNIKVYNSIGMIIDEFDINKSQIQINIEEYNSGLYYIGVENSTQSKLKKFIKN